MQIIGHRGARRLAPENTLEGFKAGLRASADWIEFDVRATKDGRVVVNHDGNLLRTGKKLRRVGSTDFDDLRKIKIFGGHTIPTLTEAMNAIAGHAKINIHIKSPGCAEAVVNNIVRHIKKGARYNDFLVSSFRPKFLKEVHWLNSRIPLGLIQSLWPYKFTNLAGLRVQAVGFYHRCAPLKAINQANRRGLVTYAYTVNSPNKAAKLAHKGIMGVATDRPDLMQNIVRAD